MSAREELARLRDRYFALAHEGATDAAFLAQVDATSATTPAFERDGLGLSWHPTRAHKVVRYVPAETIPGSIRPLFARPIPDLPHLAAAFVDPYELSFYSYENIIGLDAFLASASAPVLALESSASLGPGVLAGRLACEESTSEALRALDRLGLYAAPLDPGMRGGGRFVFHAAALASALADALRRALPAALLEGLSHVNPVFRCSRFEPDDARFRWHQDTPYSDPARGHVSRYTLLIYLTGGHGDPALELEGGVRLATIEPFTCVIFDQRLAHEGAPYVDGRKVFLRSDLVYAVEPASLSRAPAVAALFGRACYLGSHGPFDAELARWAADAYDRAARAHFGVEHAGPPVAEPLLVKSYRGARWITNGYDYWFPGDAPLAECATLAILDHLNGRVLGACLRAETTHETIPGAERARIPERLLGARWTSPLGAIDRDLEASLWPEPEVVDDGECCPVHADDFDPTRSERVIEAYREAQTIARQKLERSPIALLGREIFFVPAAFVMHAGKIHVLAERALPPFNFAAAWSCWEGSPDPERYVTTERELTTLALLVPPIPFASWRGCHHLTLDLFRNDWSLHMEEERVAVPRIALAAPEIEQGLAQRRP